MCEFPLLFIGRTEQHQQAAIFPDFYFFYACRDLTRGQFVGRLLQLGGATKLITCVLLIANAMAG